MDIQKALEIDTDLVQRILTDFIREELAKVGYTKAVVGVSGGIDSALTCTLAALALGPENVLAVRMPYRTSSPASLADAQLLIDQLGVPSETVEITPMVEPLFERFPDMDRRRRGNVMARERMIILYDLSEAWHGLVVGTGNKTEILLGYTTLYGDSACAVNPIGDLYKTQVRQLAAALDIPEPIRTKAPSADLWPDQTDEDEMGFSYEQVDRALFLLFDQGYTIEEAMELGFERAFLERVWRIVQRNQYKRTIPVIAKLSGRTIGRDFRYARDWGV
ncbi:MAG: NAD+ synthase [Chloroflexi bacterium]|nr:NAD+ synthase [Chloroflexota bacterium]